MIEVLLQAENALSLGLLDQAEILYRQVVIADPRNSIAVVGLARVALERGDEPGALAQARRALAIDGENAAARRMVQRLEEVLAFRGEAAKPTNAPAAVPSKPAPIVTPPAPAPGAEAEPAATVPAILAEPSDTVTEPRAPSPAPERRSWVDRFVRRKG